MMVSIVGREYKIGHVFVSVLFQNKTKQQKKVGEKSFKKELGTDHLLFDIVLV